MHLDSSVAFFIMQPGHNVGINKDNLQPCIVIYFD